ncbi:Alpha/beta hydrolase fold [Parasponia andersonii]|uniref:Alpha/beta hydrolase fold n=1 Tax=Parasponia andersonii TaxID=3476 RepID=A0A2P5DD18_PARAD|nr:Alpha/beta hydrolase fold [Parasponia andersonii]
MLKRINVPVLSIGSLSRVYSGIRPPLPKISGSPGGLPITAPRIRLRDGRHLAYKEYGMPKEDAKHRIIFVHGFTSSRHDAVVATTLSPEFIQDLGVYVVGFDKPGYGESDPHPNRTIKSLALDIEELGDQLGLGSKFYVIGNSMGGQAIWGCLKYIPTRLARAGLMAPVINYWWPSFPANMCREAYNQQPLGDQWALRVAHYAPWLTYWWNTQKLFPASSVIARNPDIFSAQDLEIVKTKLSTDPEKERYKHYATQQGEFESLHRSMMIGFGNWEFDPMDLKNPFPNNEGSVHLWQGDEDRLVPVTLQRYIVNKLPWIHYHELAGAGHFFPHAEGMGEAIIKQFLTGEKQLAFSTQ